MPYAGLRTCESGGESVESFPVSASVQFCSEADIQPVFFLRKPSLLNKIWRLCVASEVLGHKTG